MAKIKTLIFLLLSISASIDAQCVDEKGQYVDWVAIYKLPRLVEANGDPKNYIEQGLGYAYITAAAPEKGWIMSEKSVKDFTSIPGRILSPIYSQRKNKDLFHLFYNDEHPDGNTSFTLGHTKGSLVFNDKYGFWLVHSVPKYPPALEQNQDYDYPHTGQMYGQSFLCISLLTQHSANEIGLQLMINQPYIYSTQIPKWVNMSSYPNMYQAANGLKIKNQTHNVMKIRSLGNHDFISFAKNRKFAADLYSKLVVKNLKMNLMVESWPNGPGKMTSSCKDFYHVLNIDSIEFKHDDQNQDIKFPTHKDHSKWAVTYAKAGKPDLIDKYKYVCIGDINRMESQKKRGGGTVCFQNKDAWKAFYELVSSFEACPK